MAALRGEKIAPTIMNLIQKREKHDHGGAV